MSWNPPLARADATDKRLFPLPQAGERLILVRKGIDFAVQTNEKVSGKGIVFLSNLRLVFLKDGDIEKHKKFSSVELPLKSISGKERSQAPEFKQPIFGANYLKGNCLPSHDAEYPFPMNGAWTLTFMEGGCQAFLKAFYRVFENAKNSRPQTYDQAQNLIHNVFNGNAAYVDPTDPSVLYTVQPVADQQLNWNPTMGGYSPMVPVAAGTTAAAAAPTPSPQQTAPGGAAPYPPGMPPLMQPVQPGMMQPMMMGGFYQQQPLVYPQTLQYPGIQPGMQAYPNMPPYAAGMQPGMPGFGITTQPGMAAPGMMPTYGYAMPVAYPGMAAAAASPIGGWQQTTLQQAAPSPPPSRQVPQQHPSGAVQQEQGSEQVQATTYGGGFSFMAPQTDVSIPNLTAESVVRAPLSTPPGYPT